MNTPLISLIIPVHNAEKYIDECLSSAIAQTYENLEIIVVDDSSTDRSVELMHSYANTHKNIHYMRVENGNAARTRRDGIKQSRSDLVCFLDADDVLDKNYVERLYEAMRITKTDISACSIEIFSGDFKQGKSPAASTPDIIDSDVDSFARHYHMTSTNKLTLQTLPCKLLKKDLFKNIDYTVLVTNIFEDNFIMAQILHKVKKISIVDETLYWYRQTSGTTSGGTVGTKVEYNGKTLNSVEFFKDVVMEYCKKMLNGPNVDAAIDKLCAAEFYNYARMVPDLVVHKDYLEEKIKLEESHSAQYQAEIKSILDSKSYRVGHALVLPVSNIITGIKKGK